MAIRFRTQDTKANWARKLNALLAPLGLTPDFREVPQTLQQWQAQLRRAADNAFANGYAFARWPIFDVSVARTLWARSLNALAEGVQAGAARTLTIAAVATNDEVTDAEAGDVDITGTSVGLPDGTSVTVRLDGVVLGSAPIASNAWSLASQDLTAVVNGAHTLTAKTPTSAQASRPITRVD